MGRRWLVRVRSTAQPPSAPPTWAWYAAVLEVVTEGVVVIAPDGRPSMLNRAARDLLGLAGPDVELPRR